MRIASSQVQCLWRIKRYGLAGGSTSPGAGFVASKALQHFELALFAYCS